MSAKFSLSTRHGPPPKVGEQPPQLQFSDEGPEAIKLALKQWGFSAFPNVTEHDTLISVPTSRAMWLAPTVEAAHPDAFMPPEGSREFCHFHLDGSVHAVVAHEVEEEILRANWGVRHPWHHKGVKEIMIYAPRNEEELVIMKKVVVQSYQYVTGDTKTEIKL
jgi:hypothetical protein